MAKTRQISFRLPEAEYQKLAALHEKAKQRTLGYAPLGDVLLELMGLIPLNLIAPEECFAREPKAMKGAKEKKSFADWRQERDSALVWGQPNPAPNLAQGGPML